MKLKALKQYVLTLEDKKVQFVPNQEIEVKDLNICKELIEANWAEEVKEFKAVSNLKNKAINSNKLENKKKKTRGKQDEKNNINN